MRITPINIYNSNQLYKQSNEKKSVPQHIDKNFDEKIAFGSSYNFIAKTTSSVQSEGINLLKNQLSLFPDDIIYRAKILKGLGIDVSNVPLIRSIIGPDEFTSIVKTFNDVPQSYAPGKSFISEFKDGYDLSGVENRIFRASLHTHTNHSDGRLSVQELLDKASEYADSVAATNPEKAPYAPFTIAISDHDTIEGCKEAVEIIRKNPLKYKNLRVVLGCEFSVESKMVEQKLKAPITLHMLAHGLNPFDSELNAFMNRSKEAREILAKDLVAKAQQKLSTEYPETAKRISLEEGKEFSPVLKHRILHVDYGLKDYLQFRTIFSECFENNKGIQSILSGKKINFQNTQTQYSNNFKRDFSKQSWQRYVDVLHDFCENKLGIKNAKELITVSPKLEQTLYDLEKISNEAQPQLNLSPAFNDMAETIEMLQKQDSGFATIAHPGLLRLDFSLENSSEVLPAMENFMKQFKQKGGERALGAEIYYHYFGKLGESSDWLNSISWYAKNAGLKNTGGIDTHGTNIFYGNTDSI